MTVPTPDAAPFIRLPAPSDEALLRPSLRALNDFVSGAAKFMAILALGAMCAASSFAFLLSAGIAMPVLTGQFESWLKAGQWTAMPLSTVLTKMGHQPHFDGSMTRAVSEWLISCETGLVMVATAGVFVGAVTLFEMAGSRSICKAQA